jgi:hypothetical protein
MRMSRRAALVLMAMAAAVPHADGAASSAGPEPASASTPSEPPQDDAAMFQSPPPQGGQPRGPSDNASFWRDSLMRFGEVYAWPLIIVGALLVFGGRVKALIDALLYRMRNARRFNLLNIWHDEFEEELRPILVPPEAARGVHRVGTQGPARDEHAPFADHANDVAVEPATSGEPVRETLVRVIAATAVKAFRVWRQFTNRNFPDEKMALLAWIADVGAPQVMRSYEVFVAVAERLSHRHPEVWPPPPQKHFEAQVSAFNRDHRE